MARSLKAALIRARARIIKDLASDENCQKAYLTFAKVYGDVDQWERLGDALARPMRAAGVKTDSRTIENVKSKLAFGEQVMWNISKKYASDGGSDDEFEDQLGQLAAEFLRFWKDLQV